MPSIIPDHLDGVNQARKALRNGGNSPRLSHPVVLSGEEENGTSHLRDVVSLRFEDENKNRICHLLELVLRGFFTPVRHKVLLRGWEVVREELLSIDALPKNAFEYKATQY